MKRLLILTLVFIVTLTGYLYRKENSWTKYNLIAHAAGGIDGARYTNSKEAFLNSYKQGYKLFEIDLSLTRDEQIVARHDWDKSYGQKGHHSGKAMSYNEFMSQPYFNKYTPNDFNMVIDFMKKYPGIFVILDGKVHSSDDMKQLYEKVGKATCQLDTNIKKRLIPQMFYKEDLETIRQYGFQDLLYVVGRENYTPDSLATFCNANNINAVSLSKSRTNQTLVDTLSKHNIKIFMYTLNDTNEMKRYIEKGVDGFFTDFITPRELNG